MCGYDKLRHGNLRISKGLKIWESEHAPPELPDLMLTCDELGGAIVHGLIESTGL